MWQPAAHIGNGSAKERSKKQQEMVGGGIIPVSIVFCVFSFQELQLTQVGGKEPWAFWVDSAQVSPVEVNKLPDCSLENIEINKLPDCSLKSVEVNKLAD